jgi:hypothetical protein
VPSLPRPVRQVESAQAGEPHSPGNCSAQPINATWFTLSQFELHPGSCRSWQSFVIKLPVGTLGGFAEKKVELKRVMKSACACSLY